MDPAKSRPNLSRTLVTWLAVFVLSALGVLLRLNDLTDQPLDFHPTRQLRSAIIARGMYYQMLPNADPALRDQAIGMWNTMEAYEPAILERIVALGYLVAGGEYLWISRIVMAFFWLAGGLGLFALVRKLTSTPGGLFALAFYMILPFSVVASRSFQPDPLMVTCVILAVLGFYNWFAGGGKSVGWGLLAGLSAGLAILLKVTMVFPLGAVVIGLFLAGKSRKALLKNPLTYLVILLCGIFITIYYFASPRENSAAFFQFWTVRLSDMLLDRKFYVGWLGLIRGLMDWSLFFAALLGAFLFNNRGKAIAIGLWVGYALTGLIFPYQISTHEYYSLILVPLVALCLAPIVDTIYRKITQQRRVWQAVFLLGVLAIASYYAYIARSVLVAVDYRTEPIPWVKMAAAIPTDGKIIALTHDMGNRLKYYGWRSANRYWPSVGEIQLSELAGSKRDLYFDQFFAEETQGMDYFLVTLMGDFESQPQLREKLTAGYKLKSEGDGYLLYDLNAPLE